MTAPVPPTPPGWYPDPWYPGVVRWFDGAQWTEHAAPAGGLPGSSTDVYDGAKGESTTNFAVVAFVGRGVVAGFQAVVSSFVLASVWNDLFEALDDPQSTRSTQSTFGTISGWGVASQLANLVGLAALVFVCIWTYRATKNARALGLRTAFSPGWSVAGWIIPLAAYVMPYLSVRDLFPEGHPGRRQVGIWWAFEIAGVVLAFVTSMVAVATSAGPAAAVGVAAAGFLVVAGVLGARVSRAANAVHVSIASGQPPA